MVRLLDISDDRDPDMRRRSPVKADDARFLAESLVIRGENGRFSPVFSFQNELVYRVGHGFSPGFVTLRRLSDGAEFEVSASDFDQKARVAI